MLNKNQAQQEIVSEEKPKKKKNELLFKLISIVVDVIIITKLKKFRGNCPKWSLNSRKIEIIFLLIFKLKLIQLMHRGVGVEISMYPSFEIE